jgi:hypothetical protein
MNYRISLLIAFVLLMFSCSSTAPNTPETPESIFGSPNDLALIDKRLPEVSGLASSVVNPGYMWAVNDSGNPSEVYLIDTTAQVKMTCKLSVPNLDWEEVAVGPGPDPDKTYVYVGDIGDNNSIHEMKNIYRFEEPAFDAEVKDITLTDTLRIKLSDGKRDTECMMIDPITKDLYIISKREDLVGIYKLPPLPSRDATAGAGPYGKEIMTAQKVGEIPFFQIVAGGFSKDGLEILIKDYDHIYYWKRTPGELLEDVLVRKPEQLPYKREAQGESLTWRLDGTGYYTLSETNLGKPAYLRFYKRK